MYIHDTNIEFLSSARYFCGVRMGRTINKRGGKVKWILVIYNKLIVIYEVFKYLSSIDEELVMPMLQDLDQEPRLP